MRDHFLGSRDNRKDSPQGAISLLATLLEYGGHWLANEAKIATNLQEVEIFSQDPPLARFGYPKGEKLSAQLTRAVVSSESRESCQARPPPLDARRDNPPQAQGAVCSAVSQQTVWPAVEEVQGAG